MPDSIIVEMVKAQKKKILEREAQVMAEMTRRWFEVERALEAEMLKTVIELGGEGIVTEAMILRNTRFQSLMYQARNEYSKYSDFMENKVTDLQQVNGAFGIGDANKVLEASMAEAGIEIAYDRLNYTALEAMFGFTADGSPLRSLLMDSYGESVNGIMSELVNGLAKGAAPLKTARAMADGFGVGLDRALTIARTEQLRAYRMGALEQYRASDVVGQYKRLATKDDKTCLGCLFSDGVTFDSVDDFSEHPNGRCVVVPVVRGVEPPTWETGREWFEKLSEDRQVSILGDRRFEMWQGGVSLSDMSTHKENSTWGGSFIPTPLNELNK